MLLKLNNNNNNNPGLVFELGEIWIGGNWFMMDAVILSFIYSFIHSFVYLFILSFISAVHTGLVSKYLRLG